MWVAECREEDVPLLDRHLPPPSMDTRHASRLARQRAGDSTFLVAWRPAPEPHGAAGRRLRARSGAEPARVPVGSCEVRWTGCAAPEVRAAHPGTPEINGLGAWPEILLSECIGRALIRAAEVCALQRRLPTIGLGVLRNNAHAMELCRRLGYRLSVPYLDCWTYKERTGLVHRVADASTFMVKDLEVPVAAVPPPESARG